MRPPLQIDVFHQGDVLAKLKLFPDKCCRCCVTSPPYYGLRDYGTGIWIGGDEKCDHKKAAAETIISSTSKANIKNTSSAKSQYEQKLINKNICNRCGARRIDLQIGLEKTPELYIKKLVRIFRELKRVLTDDGTLWLNIGDSYWGGKIGRDDQQKFYDKTHGYTCKAIGKAERRNFTSSLNLKPKDLIGIPWMLAFALRADGWYLRSDIIWQKPNPMPESVTDRPTKAHEYIFLLTKSAKYYYDAIAIRQPLVEYEVIRRMREKEKGFVGKRKIGRDGKTGLQDQGQNGAIRSRESLYELIDKGAANKKSVWTVTTKPFKEAHFATFPEDLIVDCIKAGTSEHGKCADCGKPWIRIAEKELKPTNKASKNTKPDQRDALADANDQSSNRVKDCHQPGYYYEYTTKEWRPSCECHGKLVKHREKQYHLPFFKDNTDEIIGYEPQPDYVWYEYKPDIPIDQHPVLPDLVIDIFSGAGTTSLVAKKLNRNFIGIELNPEYISMSEKRLQKELGMFYSPVKSLL